MGGAPVNALKASWEVRAGVISGDPRADYTRHWRYTSEDYAEDEAHRDNATYHSIFAKLRAEALDYYVQVSMPNLNNWAEISFLWY